MVAQGKSITAVTFDAQYSRIQELYNNLYILKTSDYKVDLK